MTFGLICTSCKSGVQENGAIGLVVLQSAEILWLIIFLAIHFLCVSIRDRGSDLYVGIDMVKNYCLQVTKTLTLK